ncbi:MAG TPA: PAS domain S-box protein [Gemmatimonadales bacterium]|nr:PAS domain S-box protein [Gemmatimonadales bacterium]
MAATRGLLASTADSNDDAVCAWNVEGRILAWNRGAERLYGYAADEIVGRPMAILCPPGSDEERAALTAAVNLAVTAKYLETVGRRRDGTTFPAAMTISPIRDAEGKIVGASAITRDITERKRAEQSERAAYAIAQAGLSASTLDELYGAIHRIVRELMPARNLYIALQDDRSDVISFPYFMDEMDQRPEPRRPGRGLTEYVLRTGQTLLGTPEVLADLERRGEIELLGAPSIDWLGVPLRSNERAFGVLAVQSYAEGERYTEQHKSLLEFVASQVGAAIKRKDAEEAVRRSEARSRAVVEVSREGVLFTDADGIIRYRSPGFERITGYTEAERLGHSALEWVHPEDTETVRRWWAKMVANAPRPETIEYRLRHKNGTWRWVETSAQNFLGDPDVRFIVDTTRDITERRLAEDALRESELRYRTLFEQAGDCILLLELMPHGPPIIRDLNVAAEDGLGYARGELLGQPASLVQAGFSLDVYRRRRQEMSGGQTQRFEARLRRKDGTEFEVEVEATAFVIAGRQLALVVARDLTERRRAAEAQARMAAQVQEAQKMESVGRLAGGVAHDFNNALQVILLSAERALLSPDATPALRQQLQSIEKTSKNAASLVAQLMAFARRQPTQPKGLDLNEVTASFLPMLRGMVGEDVVVDWTPGRDVGAVWLDPAQFEQVVVNLATNARDAMRRGGHLTLTTSAVTLSEGDPGAPADLPPGAYVCLVMADDGCGMNEEVLAHAFEPFFTTKPRGEGTGLGLASVFGIVKQNGGSIRVTSTEGAGTTVTIFWPQYRTEAAPSVEAEPAASAVGATEVLLVVDDDPMVLDVSVACLEAFGYTVLHAGGPREALQVAERHRGPIALLVADVVMPGMGGPELADRLCETRPGLRRLFLTGQADTVLEKYGLSGDEVRVVRKPFEIADLARAVRETLEQ